MFTDRYRASDPDRKFLQSRKWRERIRPQQLARFPLCEHCEKLGIIRAATEVDHIRRPRGDKLLQIDSANFQSLCSDHHQAKSLWERRNNGRPLIIGVEPNGWPIELVGGAVKKSSHD